MDNEIRAFCKKYKLDYEEVEALVLIAQFKKEKEFEVFLAGIFVDLGNIRSRIIDRK